MAQESFRLTFEGPAVDQGSMAVTDLLPALLGTARAISRAEELLEPDAPQVRVEVQATSGGSFIIDLIVYDTPALWEQAADLLTGREVTAVVNLIAVLTAMIGAIQYLLAARGRRIHSQEEFDTSRLRVILDGGARVETTTSALRLATDRAFRREVRKAAEPLGRRGITTLGMRVRQERVVVNEQDLDVLDVPESTELAISEGTRTAVLRLIRVAFVEGNKWSVAENGRQMWVAVEDARFAHSVVLGQEAFSAGDILRVRLRTRTYEDGAEEPAVEHAIVEVLEHVRGPVQMALDFRDPGSGGFDHPRPSQDT